MTDKLKKLGVLLLSAFIVLTSIFNFPIYAKDTKSSNPVSEGTLADTGVQIGKGANIVWWKNGIDKISLDREIVFCVEPNVIGLGGSYYEENSFSAELTKELSLIVYYGWDSTSKSDDDYAVTQYMIWEKLGWSPVLWYGSFGNRYDALKSSVQSKINAHNEKPSFNGSSSYEVNVGETLRITDTNNVLEKFHIRNDGGANVKIEGNTLVITPSSTTPNDLTIQLQKIPQQYCGATIIYKSNASDGQDVGKFKVFDPNASTLKIKVNKTGSLKLAKVDEDGNTVPNTTFKTSYNADMSGTTWQYTTGADGTVTVDNWEPRTVYIQEVSVPDHLVLDSTIYSIQIQPNQTVTYTATNSWKKGKIQLRKTDEDNGSQVGGAVYGIFNSSGTEVQRLTTLESGYVESAYLRYGDYTVKEIIPPVGYVLNPKVYSVKVSDHEQRITVDGVDAPIKGKIKVVKKDIDSGKIIALAGSQFAIYKKDGTFVATITTGNDGIATSSDLRYGEYYFVETKAPDGYLVDDTKQPFSIVEDKVTVTKEKTDKRVVGSVGITKVDAETGAAQGDATLEGAVYGLYAKENILDPADQTILYPAGTLISQQTITKGKAAWNDLYLGKYYVQEITPSEGYLLDPTKYNVDILYQDQTTVEIHKDITVKEQVKKQAFSIIKISSGTNGGEGIGLQGAEFTVKLQSEVDQVGFEQAKTYDVLVTDQAGFATSKELPYGVYRVREIKVPDEHAPVNDFTVIVNEDSRDPQPYRVFVDEQFEALVKAVKLDKETGKIIPLEGTKFKIKNLTTGEYVKQWVWFPIPHQIETFETGKDGTFTTPNTLKPAKYRLEEIKAPYGYILNETPVEFEVTNKNAYETAPDGKTAMITVGMEDVSVKGKIRIDKEAELFKGYEEKETPYGTMYQPIFEKGLLAGVTFEIIAKEDIIGKEGTLHYHVGEVVDTITSDGINPTVSKELPLGSYTLKEVATVEGYVLDKKEYDFTLEYEDQYTEIIYHDEEIWNVKQRGYTAFTKEFEESFFHTPEELLKDVRFGLFTAKEMNGLKEGSLLAIVGLDEALKESFEFDFAGNYYIQELATNGDYVLNDTKYPLEYKYDGSELTSVSFVGDKKETIYNVLKRGKVHLYKSDQENHKALINVPFALAIDEEMKQIIKTGTTNEQGYLLFEELEYGTYYIQEMRRPEGYVNDNTIHKVKICETSQAVELNITNQAIKGKVTFEKIGEAFVGTISGQTEFGITQSPIWEKQRLLGAELTICAAEDITTWDQHEWYKKDQVVQVLESDWEMSESIELPVGKYYAYESKVPHGYVEDLKRYSFEIKDNGEAEVQINPINIYNERASITLDFTKKLETQGTFINQDAYKDVVFGIFAREDIYNYMGGVAIEHDTMIYTSGIDENGKLVDAEHFDLPIGAYYLKELSTNSQYVLDEKEYDFTIEYAGENVHGQIIHINDGNEVENALKRGAIEVIKVDQDDKEIKLEGVTFEIAKDEEFKNVIATGKTDQNGKISFENLEMGTYYIRETETKTSYVLTEEIMKVDLTQNEQVLQLEVLNRQTEMEFMKLDKETKEGLEGAELAIVDLETNEVVTKWISSKEAMKVKGLYQGKNYTLEEIRAPKGYQIAEKIVFNAKDGMQIVMEDEKEEVIQTSDFTQEKKIILFAIASFAFGCMFLTKRRKGEKHSSY